jgi:phosphoglycolate phosphatase-like HAD superfamily hydrolase
MKPTVLLFDIDGTLVTTDGAGRRALCRAFQHAFGTKDCLDFPFDGMTDVAILRRALAVLGRSVDGPEKDDLLGLYLRFLEEEVQGANMARYRVHDGMLSALDAADERGCAVGLGTGNVREGARLKLSRVSIYHRFAFGGFGCDCEDRAELLRIGAERGAQRLGVPLSECRTVVIGDTPKDVAAALALGAECVGVGTGMHSAQALLQCGASSAFDSLAHPDALRALLGE